MDIEPRYATFWPRVGASLVDGLLFLALLPIWFWLDGSHVHPAIRGGWLVAYSLSYYVYSVTLHTKYGQTLGKMATKVRVLDVSETKLRFRQAVLRDSVAIALTLIGIALSLPRTLGTDYYGLRDLLGMIHDPESVPPGAFQSDPGSWILTWTNCGWFLVEVVTMLTNRKRRAVHDFIAGTVVVNLPEAVTEETLDGATA